MLTVVVFVTFCYGVCGWWVTPGACIEAYMGSGPVPVQYAATVRRQAEPLIADAARTTVAGATAPAAPKAVPMSLAMIQPAYADSGALRGTLTAPDRKSTRLNSSH